MIREEVNQTLNELCQYGGIMLGSRYVEAIRIAAIFYETGEDTATKEDCALTDCKCNDNGRCTDGLAYKESCYDCYQTAMEEEKSCENCKYEA